MELLMMDIESLLKEKCGKDLTHVKEMLEKKKEELKGKKYANEKDVWSKDGKGKKTNEIGRCVTLIQSNYPVKMFVLQEISAKKEIEPEIRFGYYTISPKRLREKGELRLVWGQYNPSIPKKDLIRLIEMAKEEKIL
jgi:hypothetical protein